MGVKMTGRYLGGKRVELRHEPSGATITTSAPKDNLGDGLLFSPTDLIGASLASCMITTIAILAEKRGLTIEPMTVEIEKIMQASPRRVAELPVTIHLPKRLSAEDRSFAEQAARGCPVHASLHADVKVALTVVYDL